jgi:Ca2+-binding RTX toxin-like protein
MAFPSMSITRAGFAAGAALLTAVLVTPSANAATLTVAGTTATLLANPGEVNNVQAETSRLGFDSWTLDVTDAGAPLVAGAGCTASGAVVSCPNVDTFVVSAGDRDDQVRLQDRTGFPNASLYGQNGHDALTVSSTVGLSPLLDGGAGNDTLTANMNAGGDQPVLRGGAGNDALNLLQVGGGQAFGGAGDDQIVSGTTSASTPLHLEGEGGNDTYTFLVPFRARPETLVPGGGFDTLDESDVEPNEFRPFEFNLNQCAAGCVEQVIGTAGDDFITGDGRSQIILAGAGNDTLDGGGGIDLLSGQDGDDFIEARDGTFDTIGCDGGFDAVFADPFDLVSSACDDVTRDGAEEPSV